MVPPLIGVIEVHCPCGEIHRISARYIGRVARCPNQKGRFCVPSTSSAVTFLEDTTLNATTETWSALLSESPSDTSHVPEPRFATLDVPTSQDRGSSATESSRVVPTRKRRLVLSAVFASIACILVIASVVSLWIFRGRIPSEPGQLRFKGRQVTADAGFQILKAVARGTVGDPSGACAEAMRVLIDVAPGARIDTDAPASDFERWNGSSWARGVLLIPVDSSHVGGHGFVVFFRGRDIVATDVKQHGEEVSCPLTTVEAYTTQKLEDNIVLTKRSFQAKSGYSLLVVQIRATAATLGDAEAQDSSTGISGYILTPDVFFLAGADATAVSALCVGSKAGECYSSIIQTVAVDDLDKEVRFWVAWSVAEATDWTKLVVMRGDSLYMLLPPIGHK